MYITNKNDNTYVRTLNPQSKTNRDFNGLENWATP